MKPEEVQEMAELWERGLSLRQIAEQMCYSESWISDVMRKHRPMFPKRKKPHTSVSAEKREQYVARILAGRTTVRRAALALDVRYDTVCKWVNKAKEDA